MSWYWLLSYGRTPYHDRHIGWWEIEFASNSMNVQGNGQVWVCLQMEAIGSIRDWLKIYAFLNGINIKRASFHIQRCMRFLLESVRKRASLSLSPNGRNYVNPRLSFNGCFSYWNQKGNEPVWIGRQMFGFCIQIIAVSASLQDSALGIESWRKWINLRQAPNGCCSY